MKFIKLHCSSSGNIVVINPTQIATIEVSAKLSQVLKNKLSKIDGIGERGSKITMIYSPCEYGSGMKYQTTKKKEYEVAESVDYIYTLLE